MLTKLFLSLFVSTFLVSAVVVSGVNKPTGPALTDGETVTGAPDESTCVMCHNADVSYPDYSFKYEEVAPDLYDFELAVKADEIAVAYGYQGVCLSEENKNSGTFIKTDSMSHVKVIDLKEYIEHSFPSLIPLDDSIRIKYRWYNTEGDDLAKFYFSILQTNYDGTANGDEIFHITPEFRKKADPIVYRSGFNTIRITYNEPFSVKVYDVTGRVFFSRQSSYDNPTVDFSMDNVLPTLLYLSFFDSDGKLFHNTKTIKI